MSRASRRNPGNTVGHTSAGEPKTTSHTSVHRARNKGTRQSLLDCGVSVGRIEASGATEQINRCQMCTRMDSDSPREIPTELVENDARSRSRDSMIRKVLCAVSLVGVVLSAIYVAPSGPSPGGEACGLSLLHMFVAILCLSIVLLSSSGPNVIANHGGIGLLVGLFISFIFNASLKGGMIFFLFGAFPGAIFGLLIGSTRRGMAAPPLASADGTGEEHLKFCERALRLPLDSPEHCRIRDSVFIGGSFLAARYFLTILTGKAYDYPDVPQDQFLDALRRFLIVNVSPNSAQFCLDCEGEGHVSYVVLPVLMSRFYGSSGMMNPHKMTREQRGLILLLENPYWTDSQIRDVIGTTDEQMKRWSDFKLARRMQTRFGNGER